MQLINKQTNLDFDCMNAAPKCVFDPKKKRKGKREKGRERIRNTQLEAVFTFAKYVGHIFTQIHL